MNWSYAWYFYEIIVKSSVELFVVGHVILILLFLDITYKMIKLCGILSNIFSLPQKSELHARSDSEEDYLQQKSIIGDVIKS